MISVVFIVVSYIFVECFRRYKVLKCFNFATVIRCTCIGEDKIPNSLVENSKCCKYVYALCLNSTSDFIFSSY